MERKTYNGVIFECAFCGEDSKGNKYCSTCKTQKGRKEMFEANAIIYHENEKLGYTVPKIMKDWH